MLVFYSPECLNYERKGHPESPKRIERIHNTIKNKYKIKKPELCEEKDLASIHSKKLIKKIKEEDFTGTTDNPNYKDIYKYACLSAGGAIKAMNKSLQKENSFSLMRPPGHHAGKDFFGGFCYFNNISIAVKKAMENNNASNIAILDFDCHHGNGTQNIFLGNENVLYVSLHQSFLYPGTGLKSKKNCINYPLPPGTKPKKYLESFGNALNKIKRFNPDLLAVSAGFDTYKKEAISNMELETNTFRKMGEKISKLLSDLDINCFIVMEGGYTNKVGECVDNFINGIEK